MKKAYFYTAFGLKVSSSFPINIFRPDNFGVADVNIYEGTIPPTLSNIINKGALFLSNETEFLLKIDNLATLYIKDGKEIIIQRHNDTDIKEIYAFIAGSAFGALLHQRSILPLHASTVIYKGECLVFAGISGVGKTTLIAALLKKGGILVTDDISAINIISEIPLVQPGFPVIKIWEDSLNRLELNHDQLEHVRRELKKYYLPINSFCNTGKEIFKIFILNSNNKPIVESRLLHGVDKFRALRRHTYLLRSTRNTTIEQNHFISINKLISKIPVISITRPNSEFNIELLLKKIFENDY